MAAKGVRSTRFEADAMLGSFARKLRAFGFDAGYYRGGSDTGILTVCRRQGRVLLTMDRQLAARATKRGLRVMLLSGQSDRARLSSLIEKASEIGLELRRGEPRCSLCNGELGRAGAKLVQSKIPFSVARRHRVFYFCLGCGQVYWRGGHWKKLRSLEALLGSRS